MELWQRIQEALIKFAKDIEELSVVKDKDEYFFDTSVCPNDEVNLTVLAKELETAISIKRD